STCSSSLCHDTVCPGTTRNCDQASDCETNISNTLTSCGSCTNNCTTSVLNASSPSCSASACNYGSCNTGFADCDANRGNGGETNTTNKKFNCGACNRPCADPADGVASCVSSVCTFTCNTGFKKCSATCIPTASCCVDTDCQSPPDDCRERIGR